MRVLVTGGAGYIGSFMINSLLLRGDSVVVLDNLERGHISVVNRSAKFIKGDIRDREVLETLFLGHQIDAIMHFAGLISVEESTKNPDLYYENNVIGSKILFEVATRNKVNNFIFSSTAAVYGNPVKVPIPEDHPKNPTSPYGKTKLETEKNLSSIRDKNPSVSFACLRYFNASGGALDGSMGESHNPETHIIPLAIKAAMRREEFKLFGTDYNTPDGTCIRDYIHVLDLVDAHILALNKITQIKGGYFYNVGTGSGISNKEVVEMVIKVSGLPMTVSNTDRRSGDVDTLIADPTKIQQELNFKPRYSNLETIVNTAWQWHSRNIKY